MRFYSVRGNEIIFSLIAKSRQSQFGVNTSANLLSSLATQQQAAQQQQQQSQSQQPDIDRAQLLFETIRAAQAAHANTIDQSMSDNEEPDAVVNPAEPINDHNPKSQSEDEIEIIHTATDDT